MTHDRHEHWQKVYATKAASEVSWYAPHLADSLRLIREASTPASRVLDVGGGASTLVDDLLELGYADVTVLDVSEAALQLAQERLGARAPRVKWIAADVTTVELPAHGFDVWHDRAVFHFLTAAADRLAYVQRLEHALAPGGHVVIATFALGGPTKCSGLDVVRYDAEALGRELGPRFELVTSFQTSHTTPAAKEQRFVFCSFRKRS